MQPPPTNRAQLARFIDHTILRPETTAADVDRLCDECLRYGFYCACVNPVWVARCVDRLRGSGVAVASVAGFPLGASTPAQKVCEAAESIEAGAAEIDMVVHIGDLLAGQTRAVTQDIGAVVEAVKRRNERALVKVILETRALTREQIIAGCRCVAEAQADFVKTSTGFHAAGGASAEDVALLHRHAAPLRVKASGGIRDLAAALEMIRAGADRLGTSSSVAIVEGMPA